MRHLILLFILIYFNTAYCQKRMDVSFQDQGFTREAIISIPSKNPPSGGYPIVFMLHGTSGDATTFYNSKGWRELGEEKNFITVFPSALRWCYVEDSMFKLSTKFVCGDLVDKICPAQADKIPDDVIFFKRLLKMIIDTFPVNTNKIFASGFSNGDVMVNKLAMEAGNIFSAIAGSGGILHVLDSVPNPIKRIPIWYTVGTHDDRFLVPPFNSIPYGGDSSLLYLNNVIRRFVDCQGLTTEYSIVESPINKTFVFDQCQPGVVCRPFLFTINRGQTHSYANGNNYPFDAPKFFWSFFNGELTSTKEENHATKQDTWQCFPNPAANEMTIHKFTSHNGQWSFRVIDIYGREIINKENISEEQARISLPKGGYILQINDKDGSSYKKIVFM